MSEINLIECAPPLSFFVYSFVHSLHQISIIFWSTSGNIVFLKFSMIVCGLLIKKVQFYSLFPLFLLGSPVLKKQAPRTMSTLHEDTNVEEAEAIIEAKSHGKVPEDKCQSAAAPPQRPSILLDKSSSHQPQHEVSRLLSCTKILQ